MPIATTHNFLKYNTTHARIAPSWIKTVNESQNAPSPRWKKRSASSKWPVEATGRNSVTPSMMPRITARIASDIFTIHFGWKSGPLLAYSSFSRNRQMRIHALCRGFGELVWRPTTIDGLLSISEIVKGCMFTLFHHPFCPHSRFIRLVFGEYGLDLRLVEERGWERREGFLPLNPAGTTPVLVEEEQPIPGATIIAEYVDEACGAAMGVKRLMPETLAERVEVRRLMAWFNEKFFEEVSHPLVTERLYKRFMSEENGGGAPSAHVMRAAKSNVRYHLAYIGWLAQTRIFLAGDRLTYADLAAAAQLSAIDYLGDVPWSEDDAAKAWYVRSKSRPSFRPLLNEWLAGLPAPAHYIDLDF